MTIADRMTVIVPGESPPRDGRWNMAADESLCALSRCGQPILRVYGWSTATVTFGYFQSHREIRKTFPNRIAVRRWTGGGAVLHGDPAEFTYSVYLPREHSLAGCRPRQSYRRLHEAVATALVAAGVEARLIDSDADGPDFACFERPVEGDIILSDGTKVAGAAQRRTREGVLIQGSIRLPNDIPPGLADHLIRAFTPAPDLAEAKDALDQAAVQHLVDHRYGLQTWTDRVP